MKSKVSYSKLFKPPKFLEMPSVAIEILPNGITFMSTKNSDRGLIPDQFGFVPLASGDFAQGEIIKRERIISILADIRRRTGLNFVRFSIPEEKTYFFKTNLPVLSDKEIRDILDFKLEENIPLSAKEAVFDYDVVPKTRKSSNIEIVVSAAPLKTVQDFQDAFNQAGLTPIFSSPESSNVARSVVKKGNEQILIIANIRSDSIVLSLVVSGVVYQTSSINFGGSTFTDLLAKYYKVSTEEAHKIKREKLYNDNPDNMEVFSYLINTISAIKDEIYRFISYCNSREDITGEVDRIILCGHEAMIVGLEKYLATNLNIRVEIANIWTNNFDIDDYTPSLTRLESLNYAVVNGLNLF